MTAGAQDALRCSEARARVNGIELDYAVYGPDQGVPLLMIMGLGMQRTSWPPALLSALVARGFRCITFDNRDVGLSTSYAGAGSPPLPLIMAARLLRLSYRLPYTLADIADDGAALLAHLGIDGAHVLGISMGGMVAQHLASRHPARVRTLTLMATSSGRLGLPPPHANVLRLMLGRPRGRVGLDEAVDYLVRLFQAIGSPAYPSSREDIARRARVSVQRAPVGTAIARQMAAIAIDADRTPMLRGLKVPTLILHGTADTLVPLAHGEALSRAMPQATFVRIEGWGHDLPEALANLFAERVARHAGLSEPAR